MFLWKPSPSFSKFTTTGACVARIEHGYRFDQEQGLDVEDMRVHTLDRMRRLFAIVLLSAQIVFVIAVHWPPKAVLWLRQLGGKLGLASDRDGPYWLLQGISPKPSCCLPF